MTTFAPTTEDQTPYAQWHRYGAGPVVVDVRGAGAPADRWWARLGPDEIYENGRSRVGVVPTLPFCSSPPVITPVGGLEVGTVLGATSGTWSQGAVITYQWVRDGHPITHANGTSYVVALDDAGAVLACLVTGTNTAGSASQISNVSTPVATEAPVNLTAPTIVASGLVLGSELSVASTGTWSGTPTSYSYQWSGAGLRTGTTYILTAADHGASISCLVTASNSAGSASAVSNAVGPANTSVPINLAPPEITPTAGLQVGTVLTVTTGSWSGGGLGNYSYQWLRSDVPIPGETGTSYVVAAADSNVTIGCIVTASNANGSSTVAAIPVIGPAALTNLMTWNGQVLTWHGQNLTWN